MPKYENQGGEFEEALDISTPIGKILDPIANSFDMDPRDKLTFTRKSVGWFIIAIHVSCFCSRAMLEVTDNQIFGAISTISWLTYSLLVPGLVILLYYRMGSLASVDIILLLPISLMWVQLIGPTTQLLFFILGILNPILWYTTGTISLLMTAGIYFAYSTRSSNSFAVDIPFSKINNSAIIFTLVMLSISAVGPLIFHNSGNNTITMLALLVCSLAAFQSFPGKSSKMLVLYATALSVMLIPSLVSTQVSGMDVQVEYFYANSVIEGFYIDIFSTGHYSTVLSTQGIIPLISIWTGMNLDYFFKLVYPLIFAYISIFIFSTYAKLFDEDIAFYSSLFTIFSVSFYTSMLDVARQGFAEIFFFSAIFLLSHSDELRAYRNRVFIIPFLASMTLAHYGINYVIYPMLWLAYIIFLFFSRRPGSDAQEGELTAEVDQEFDDQLDIEIEKTLFTDDILLDEENLFTLELLQSKVKDYNPVLNLPHLLTGTFLVFLWHSTAGGGLVISTVSHYLDMITRTYQEIGFFGSLIRTQPTQSITADIQPLHEITQILYIFIMIISIPSIFYEIRKKNKETVFKNFLSLTISCWALFALVFMVPNIAVRLDFPRVFHILSIFLAPFSFLTIMSIQKFTHRIRFYPNFDQKKKVSSILLCALFLLSSGFIYQFSDEKHRMYTDPDFDWAKFSESEVAASEWQVNHAENELDGFPCKAADYYRSALSRKFTPTAPAQTIAGITDSNFVLLSGANLESYQLFISVTDRDNEFASQGYHNFSEFFEDGSTTRSKIYDSGNANWYYTPICIRDGVVRTSN